MKQYEYNVITNRFPLKEELLNEVGKEGWELASHTYTDKEGFTGWEHIYIFKREKIGTPKGIAERKFKLDDSFKKALEEAVVSDTPAYSWMDEYYDDYIKLQASGMMFEWHPTWTGIWDKDKYAFCHDKKPKKGSPQDPATVIEYTPKGSSAIEELYERYKATEEGNKELKEYRRMLYEGNRQYFHKEVDKEIKNIEIRLLGEGKEVLATAEFSYDTYSDLKASNYRDISSEILTTMIDEYKDPKIIK